MCVCEFDGQGWPFLSVFFISCNEQFSGVIGISISSLLFGSDLPWFGIEFFGFLSPESRLNIFFSLGARFTDTFRELICGSGHFCQFFAFWCCLA